MKKCTLTIDGKLFNIFIKDGDFQRGGNELIFSDKNNPFRNIDKTIKELGYSIINFIDQAGFKALTNQIREILSEIIKNENIYVPSDFALENYHLFVSESDHAKIIQKTRSLEFADFNFKPQYLIESIENFLNIKISHILPKLKKDIVQLRINRPKSTDINPPHRDSYFEAYKNGINVWIPLINCNKHTSLALMPKSHLLKENEILIAKGRAFEINNNKYNVPCIIDTDWGMNFIRPNPKATQALIFNSSIIHGAAFNCSSKTRMSLELRLTEKT